MTRTGCRNDNAGGIFHLCARGNNRSTIFRDGRDYAVAKWLVNRMVQRHRLGLYAWAFMGNHLHLVVESGGALERPVQGLLRTFAWFFNRNHCRTGHVFGGRYLSKKCVDATQVRRYIAYCSFNPIKHGFSGRVGEYPWTSHQDLTGRRRPIIPLERERVLKLFRELDPDPIRGLETYVENWSRSESSEWDEEFESVPESRRQAAPGTDLSAAPGDESVLSRSTQFDQPLEMNDVPLDVIAQIVCESFGVPVESLAGPGRVGAVGVARATYCRLSYEWARHPLEPIAASIGRGRAAAWRWAVQSVRPDRDRQIVDAIRRHVRSSTQRAVGHPADLHLGR